MLMEYMYRYIKSYINLYLNTSNYTFSSTSLFNFEQVLLLTRFFVTNLFILQPLYYGEKTSTTYF